MADIYVKSGGGTKNAGDYRGIWTTAGNWAVGDRVVAVNVSSYRVHECTTAGAGDAAEPTWNTTTGGTTTMAAGAVFTTRIPSTWANATVDLTRASANDGAGDTIYVSDNHAESTAGTVTIALAGTVASPTRLIGADDSTGEPPTSSIAGASIATTTTNTLTISGSFYASNVIISGGGTLTLSGNIVTLSDVTLRTTGTNSVSRIQAGIVGSGGIDRIWDNVSVRFGQVAQGISAATTRIVWNGGQVESGGTAITTALFRNNGSTARFHSAIVSGVDLSNLGAACNLVEVGSGISSYFVFRNCKLPASWTGSITTGTMLDGDRVELYNCDNADTNYRLLIADVAGSIQHETTIVRTGGASDGTTTLSWKLASSSTAGNPTRSLASPEIVQWNETTGSAITATVEIVTDNVTLTDAECWLEVQYLGTSGTPLGAFVSDAKADVLATAANQTTSSETWTTTGLGTPVKQKLSVTFTPQEKGFIHAVVKVAKASTTVYVDPLLTIT